MISLRCDLATAGCSLQETGLDQERLDNIFQRIALLPQGNREILNAHGPAAEMLDDELQETSIQRFQSFAVHTETLQAAIALA